MSGLSVAIDFLARTQRIIMTTHETPDGDGIGSECAMYRALRHLGKEVLVFNADPTPRKFSFLDANGAIVVAEREDQLPPDLGEYALLMLDTNDVRNIGQIATLVLPKVRDHFIIDHHENDEDLSSGNFIQKSASSTAEIVYQILTQMEVPIDAEMAQALFTAIVYDTGSFMYPKTTALTFGIAQDLVSRGVQPSQIHARVYESNSIAALKLESRVLATLELEFGSHVAFLTMGRQMLLESGANYEESDQLINIPLKSEDVRVSVFFKENMEGLLRCSLRSKGNINVAEIAQMQGGGGHRTAAGFKCRDSVKATRRTLLDKLRIYFP